MLVFLNDVEVCAYAELRQEDGVGGVLAHVAEHVYVTLGKGDVSVEVAVAHGLVGTLGIPQLGLSLRAEAAFPFVSVGITAGAEMYLKVPSGAVEQNETRGVKLTRARQDLAVL